MVHQEGNFIASGGLSLYYQAWFPEGETRAVLAIVHGFGEHGGRFSRLVEYMTGRGYALYALDQRGHGRSPGQRGHINAWSEYREDVRAFLKTIQKKEGSKPLFLYGLSMGAVVGLDYILHYPEGLKGAIISGAPIQPTGAAPAVLILIAKILSGLWPTFSMH